MTQGVFPKAQSWEQLSQRIGLCGSGVGLCLLGGLQEVILTPPPPPPPPASYKAGMDCSPFIMQRRESSDLPSSPSKLQKSTEGNQSREGAPSQERRFREDSKEGDGRSRAGGASCPLTPADAFRGVPGAPLGTQGPVAAKSQPVPYKMISATDKCCDGNAQVNETVTLAMAALRRRHLTADVNNE